MCIRDRISNEERYNGVIKVWSKTTEDVASALQEHLDARNPIFMMADSGARGSMAQIRQLAGMRCLIANTSGKTMEIPIRANYREGLNILEYFIAGKGARKGCLLYTSWKSLTIPRASNFPHTPHGGAARLSHAPLRIRRRCV